MAYLKGAGTQADPYAIHNRDALIQWFGVDNKVSPALYAVLVADVDADDYSIPTGAIYGHLDGYGYTVDRLHVTSQRDFRGSWKRLHVKGLTSGSNQNFNFYGVFEDVVMEGGTANGSLYYSYGSTVARRVLNNSPHALLETTTVTDSYKASSGTFTGAFDVQSQVDPYDLAHYAALSVLPDLWVVDGVSYPRLKPQPVEHLIQGYAVKGNVSLSSVAAERTVVALAPGDFRYIAETQSAPDGSFFLPTGLYSDHVFVMALEHYGRQLLANKSYVLGEIVHPQQPNGYRYTCTTAGNSGATLPDEPWPTESNLIVGAAVFTPSPVYAPAVHGPVKPLLVDLLTQEPV